MSAWNKMHKTVKAAHSEYGKPIQGVAPTCSYCTERIHHEEDVVHSRYVDNGPMHQTCCSEYDREIFGG